MECYRRVARALLLVAAVPLLGAEPMLKDGTPPATGGVAGANGELFAALFCVPKDGTLPAKKQMLELSLPGVGPGQPPPLSLHFPTLYSFSYLLLFPFLLASYIFLLFHPFQFYQNSSTLFPGRRRRRRLNLASIWFSFVLLDSCLPLL